MIRLRVKNQINHESPSSTASTNQTTNRRVESSLTMARFSIGEDEDDAPLATRIANKRPRLAEPSSQSQPRSQRSVQSQPSVAPEEDEVEEELIPVEEVESDSQGSEEDEDDEDDESEAAAAADEEEEVDEEDEEDNVVQFLSEDEPVLEAQNRPVAVGSSDLGFLDTTVAPKPVFNNASGALHVVLTDPDVLDCPICLDSLCSPVFQCENGHIACSSCCDKVKRKCPSCCMPIGYSRCRAIEKVLESVKISCKYARYGCDETMSYSKKSEHEQSCPHIACYCPYSSCPYLGTSKNLYIHFGIQHAASTTRFTYNTTFTLRVETNQKHVFLQEQHESVIFILNHEVKQHGRTFGVDCVGPSTLKSGFVYQLTAKNMETSLSLQSVPQIYPKWKEHTPTKNYLTVPTEFAGYNGIMSLHVCIKKAVLAV